MTPNLNQGKVTPWNDEGGFGFIQSNEAGQDVLLYKLTTDVEGKAYASKALSNGVPADSVSLVRKPRLKQLTLPETLMSMGGFLLLGLLALLFPYRRSSSSPVCRPQPKCPLQDSPSVETGHWGS